jgi:hypothetical protein
MDWAATECQPRMEDEYGTVGGVRFVVGRYHSATFSMMIAGSKSALPTVLTLIGRMTTNNSPLITNIQISESCIYMSHEYMFQ